jgi:hypothetical protein
MTALAAVSRLTEAPIVPRWADTAVMAVVMAVKALDAAVELDKDVSLRFKAADETVLIEVPIVVFAAAVLVPSPT